MPIHSKLVWLKVHHRDANTTNLKCKFKKAFTYAQYFLKDLFKKEKKVTLMKNSSIERQ